jgi:hypothetical protein
VLGYAARLRKRSDHELTRVPTCRLRWQLDRRQRAVVKTTRTRLHHRSSYCRGLLEFRTATSQPTETSTNDELMRTTRHTNASPLPTVKACQACRSQCDQNEPKLAEQKQGPKRNGTEARLSTTNCSTMRLPFRLQDRRPRRDPHRRTAAPIAQPTATPPAQDCANLADISNTGHLAKRSELTDTTYVTYLQNFSGKLSELGKPWWPWAVVRLVRMGLDGHGPDSADLGT